MDLIDALTLKSHALHHPSFPSSRTTRHSSSVLVAAKRLWGAPSVLDIVSVPSVPPDERSSALNDVLSLSPSCRLSG